MPSLTQSLAKNLLVLSIVACSNMAFGTEVTWCLSGVTFNDDTVATGFFVFDADAVGDNKVVDWNIQTQAAAPFAGWNYVATTNGDAAVFSDSRFILSPDRPRTRATEPPVC